ncbi:hypothetical protein D3C81_975890 [compost metagenome]
MAFARMFLHMGEIPFSGGRFRVSLRLQEVAWNVAQKAPGLRPGVFHSNGLIIALLLIRAPNLPGTHVKTAVMGGVSCGINL